MRPASSIEPTARPGSDVVARLASEYELSQQREGILFWDTEERRVGFRSIPEIFPTRRVASGERVYELSDRPTDLSGITYLVDGERFLLSDFLDMEGTISAIVIQNDDVLLETYRQGATRDDTWISFSVTKSITSMLIGAAIADGYIGSVDEPVAHYLPRLRGTGYEDATIRDVLHMASGIEWNEDYADPRSDVALAGGANGIELVRYLAKLPNAAEPGTRFNYNTGETNLVGEILRSAIGNNASTYLEHRVWKPFGMESDAFWVLSTDGGTELGGCCLSMTLRDYARVGIFAMKDGVLPDGTRVLPEGWMQASTTPSRGYEGYGYLWWLFGEGTFAAQGIFGQLIFVDPESNLVIAMHSSAPAASGSAYDAHQTAAALAIRDWARNR